MSPVELLVLSGFSVPESHPKVIFRLFISADKSSTLGSLVATLLPKSGFENHVGQALN